jgi:septal ring factor EnvC (AmiA/AmiB activator)
MANLALGTAAEVVRHSPTIWSGIRSGYASIRKGLSNIKTAMSGSVVEGVNAQILSLTDEIDAVVTSLEETTDRIEELELRLEQERADNEHNREIFQAVWDWSQQSWFKRAFGRPNLPPQKIWRSSGQPKPLEGKR